MASVIELVRLQSKRNGIGRTQSRAQPSSNKQTAPLLGLREIASGSAWYSGPSLSRLTALWIVLFIAMCAWMLTGCASPGAPSEERAPIPASLTSPCDPLPDLQDGTAGSLLRWITETSAQYRDCSAKQRRLSEAIR